MKVILYLKVSSHNFFCCCFIAAKYKMVELTREEYNLLAERRGIKKLQNMSTKKS